jgi:N-acetyltransferase
MDFERVFSLRGDHVVLEPISHDHLEGLVAAATEDPGTYIWTTVPATREQVKTFIRTRMDLREKLSWLTFATRRLADDRIVGSTSFLNIDFWDGAYATGFPNAVEIGGTWLEKSAQRSAVNTEAKLLMLTHAFEVWGSLRVQLKTDSRNTQSRAGIERLGASFEGILQNHMAAGGTNGTGSIRHSALYAMTADQWPSIKTGLETKRQR